MKTTIGYKILRANGSSLTADHGVVEYALPVNGDPGPWQDVPGNGAYVAMFGGLFSASTTDHDGAILAECECVNPSGLGRPPEGVTTYCNIRILRTTSAPLDADYWAKRDTLYADYRAKRDTLDAAATEAHTAMMRREYFGEARR